MPSFSKQDSLYSISIITGPRSVLLRLELGSERTVDFDVAPCATGGLYRDLPPEIARARVLEGTDEANRRFGTALHPRFARYTLDDPSEATGILIAAAYSIVARLAEVGEEGYWRRA